MTVAELIQKLQAMPQDMEVRGEGDCEGGDWMIVAVEVYPDTYYGGVPFVRIGG